MKCENCNQNNANITYTQNINGKETTYHLCDSCASKLGIGIGRGMFDNSLFDDFFNLDSNSIINSFFGNSLDNRFQNLLPKYENQNCDICGTSFDEVSKDGKLGCSNCYYAFDEKLEPLIEQIQGAKKHVGSQNNIKKVLDQNVNDAVDMRKFAQKPNEKQEEQIRLKQNLQEKLKKAISSEDYETAAKLRDEIAKIKE